MADPIKDDDELDPVVRAAMIPDPDDEPDKGTKEADAKKESEAEKLKDETKSEETEIADLAKEDPTKEVPKAEDQKSTDEQRQTRKERREERKQRFIEKIRRESANKSEQIPKQIDVKKEDDYKPLDYEEGQYDAKELQEDREKYSERKAAEAAKKAEAKANFTANQDKFWNDLEHEAKILSTDPKYSFLDENSPDFDEDFAADVNELYLELVGFDQTAKTVKRTDLSYEKFAKDYVRRLERYAESKQVETTKTLATQQATAGIRPSGSTSSGLKKLRPGDITKMSQEEFEKNETEIDRQIMAELA